MVKLENLKNISLTLNGKEIPYDIVSGLSPFIASQLTVLGNDPINIGGVDVSIPRRYIGIHIRVEGALNCDANDVYYNVSEDGLQSIIRVAELRKGTLFMRFERCQSGRYLLKAATLLTSKAIIFYNIFDYRKTEFVYDDINGISFTESSYTDMDGKRVLKNDLPYLSNNFLTPKGFRFEGCGVPINNSEIPEYFHFVECENFLEEGYKFAVSRIAGMCEIWYAVFKQTMCDDVYRLVSLSSETKILVYYDVDNYYYRVREDTILDSMLVKLRDPKEKIEDGTIKSFKSLETDNERKAFLEGVGSVDESSLVAPIDELGIN